MSRAFWLWQTAAAEMDEGASEVRQTGTRRAELREACAAGCGSASIHGGGDGGGGVASNAGELALADAPRRMALCKAAKATSKTWACSSLELSPRSFLIPATAMAMRARRSDSVCLCRFRRVSATSVGGANRFRTEDERSI